MMTLEDYFRAALAKDVIDHSIRAALVGDRVKFYIHPERVSGDTLDFLVRGDRLIPAGWANGFSAEKPVWHCRRCDADVDPKTNRCKCTVGPSPWEPIE